MTLALLVLRGRGARAILAALPAVLRRQQQDRAYRAYVTDALKIIGENTARYAGGGYLKGRYLDIEQPEEKQAPPPEEIIRSMKQKIAAV